jgi:hypothetical protein
MDGRPLNLIPQPPPGSVGDSLGRSAVIRHYVNEENGTIYMLQVRNSILRQARFSTMWLYRKFCA